jgi:hypothetical protein
MSYRFIDSFRAGTGSNWFSSVAGGVLIRCPDDGQRNCPKHVEFHFQNKFEKLVQLVGFIIRKFVMVPSLFYKSQEHCYDQGIFYIFSIVALLLGYRESKISGAILV